MEKYKGSDRMYILAIETTGAFASVALAKDGKTVSKTYGRDRFSHLQNLAPQIEQVLKKGDAHTLSINDMDAIAVSCGPGSFTGIRIGVSTVRALAQVTGVKCVPVSSLEALAMKGAAVTDPEGVLFCPILDARRGQVYGGGYVIEEGYPVEKVKAKPYTIEELTAELSPYKKVYFLGDGIDAYADNIEEYRTGGDTEYAPEEVRYQDAVYVAKLAEKLLHDGRSCSWEELQPEYMRLAEAERKLKEKWQK